MAEEIFYRKSECDNLLNIIEKNPKGINICIDGAWGVGKSRFCREVVSELELREFKTIYFDAYKHDLQEDPLLALLGEVSQLQSNAVKKEEFIKKASKYCAPIAKSSLKALLKKVSLNAIDIEGYEDVIAEIKDSAENGVSLFIEDSIKEYNKKEESIDAIKSLIKNFLKEERSGLVIVVDELDRCRPNYSLEVIEKIKHVFDIDGVTFLLSMCKEQLLASIENLYGKSNQNESYLEKFIDFTLVLRSGAVKSSSISQSYCQYLFNIRLQYLGIEKDVCEDISVCLSDVCLKQRLTLREVEKVVDSCIRVFITFDSSEIDAAILPWYPAMCVICGYISWADNEISYRVMNDARLHDDSVYMLTLANYYKSRNESVSQGISWNELNKVENAKLFSLVAYFNNNKRGYILKNRIIDSEYETLMHVCELYHVSLEKTLSECMAKAVGAGRI